MMKEENERFLEALRAALHNKPVDWEGEIPVLEWVQLFRTAQIHKVLPMIFEAVFSSPAARKLRPEVLEPFRRQTMEQVLCQTVKTEEFLQLMGYLKEKGITPLVFKGIVCRNLYPKPDYRLSADEDILIPEEQFFSCHETVKSFGMQMVNPGQDIFRAYEVSYIKSQSPLYLELHKKLFEPDSSVFGGFNRYFEGVFDRAVQTNVHGMAVLVMDETDYLFYLICHALKHFIHCGTGIRQVCDMMLFAEAHKQEIDWTRVERQCREIDAEIFAASLFRIGQNYLGFEEIRAVLPESWRSMKVDEKALLEDTLCGGVYGKSSMSRQHSSSVTVRAVENQKSGKKRGAFWRETLFPSAARMEARYPYLKEKKWLLPVAWTRRIVKCGREILRTHSRENSAAEALKIGRERVELLRQYGIMEPVKSGRK